jgi:hypothetical protein
MTRGLPGEAGMRQIPPLATHEPPQQQPPPSQVLPGQQSVPGWPHGMHLRFTR